ncbi:MAG: choice-of-anchor D domain-containing protein, partial [Pirellulales bacterium]
FANPLTNDVLTPPTVTLSIAAADISEAGGATTATVSRNTPVTDALVVTLATGDSGEAAVQQQITIPAGAVTSAAFDINAVDDAIVDGTQTVAITATAAGYNDGSDTLEVTDDDTATLTLVIADGEISEGGATTATVSRNTPATNALVVTLATGDPSEASVQQQVTIPAGAATSTAFDINGVDDATIDGTQTVAITATAAGHDNGSDTLNVTDDDTAAVTLAIAAAEISEAGGATTATVSRNTPTTDALTVTLSSSDSGEAVVQQQVTIPAGAFTSTAFIIAATDDAIADGTQTVVITASAAGHNDGSDTLDVTDDDTAATGPEIKVLTFSGAPLVIDDGDAGYGTVRNWIPFTGAGHQNDLDYNAAGFGNDVATWTFDGLTPGEYRVSATWVPYANRATDAPYTVLNGGAALKTVNVNQELPPNDFNDLGSSWEDLGFFTITGDTLVVELSDDANGYVIADAIRIEKLAGIEDGAGKVDFGGTDVDSAVQQTFTVLNEGIANLTLSEPIELPAGYSVASGFGSTTLPPGAETTFTIQLDAAADGTFAGNISFGNNDGDENPFDIAVTGSVNPPPAVTILDDGDAGFASGGFNSFTGLGFQNDIHYASPNSGKTASWNFSGLVPGVYTIATTWTPHPNRATNAAYSIDRGAPILVNQELPPAADAVESGAAFQNLVAGYVV